MPVVAPSPIEADAAQIVAGRVSRAERHDQPFANWRIQELLPDGFARALAALPLRPAPLLGVSGKRELHNPARRYFAGRTLQAYPEARAFADLFQSAQVVQALMLLTGAMLLGTYLRVEYALDLDGFWLEPHTDIGVKAFTLFLQLGQAGQEGLGTDLYFSPGAWAERVPFGWNAAVAFIPSASSWHGFEPRPIAGVRRSIIVNYVTEEWRDRGQLAFPDRPVG